MSPNVPIRVFMLWLSLEMNLMINKEALCQNRQMIQMVQDSRQRQEGRLALGAAIINRGGSK